MGSEMCIRDRRSTLNDDYLSRVANLDLTFVVWNTLISLGENAGSDSDVGSNTSNACFMVQGDNPLEVTTESEVDENDMSYDDLSSFLRLLSLFVSYLFISCMLILCLSLYA